MVVNGSEDSHAFRGISRILIEEAANPRNMEMMDDADGKSMFTGPCGDTMTFYVKAAAPRPVWPRGKRLLTHSTSAPRQSLVRWAACRKGTSIARPFASRRSGAR